MKKKNKLKCYLCGSIAAGRDFVGGIKTISDTVEKIGARVMTKATTVNTAKKYTNSSTLKTRRGIVKRDKRWIRESDFIVSEVSQYSHGVGYEHAYAESQNKPILMLRHKSLEGQKYSAFLDGTDYKKFMFSFYDNENIYDILKKFINKYVEK
jgi:hypothetical protein